MHSLYLHKKKDPTGLIEYIYRFDEHTYSPANQILTRLFRQMIIAAEESLVDLEVEYIDAHMAKMLGVRRSQEVLELLGAKRGQIRENKKGDFVLSRIFRVPLTKDALLYFKRIQDLEELNAYRMFAGDRVKIEVYFAKTMKAYFTAEEEAKFIDLLKEERLSTKVLDNK